MSWSSLSLQPWLLVGLALVGIGTVLLMRWLQRRNRLAADTSAGAVAGWLLPALLLILGLAGIVAGLRQPSPSAPSTSAAAGTDNAVREVDFGFVELDHGGRAVAVASYKHGGSMMLRAGEVLHFQAIGDPPLPALELHLAGRVLSLPGTSGQLSIDGAAGQPLPAMMRAQGDRVSLPGGAPPRVSVKVQITGPPRVAG